MSWETIESMINAKLNEIFNEEDYHNISRYERRKKIYDYLFNSLTFDYEELNNNSGNAIKQINDLLINNRGVCNSIVYLYKIMLEKVDIYCTVFFCRDENDLHTVVLVDNGDGTFSFDDVSMAIYAKGKNCHNASCDERFDYDIEDAEIMGQGINKIKDTYKYLFFPSSGVNYFFGKKDDHYKSIKPFFIDESDYFLNITHYIKSYKKQLLAAKQRV